MLTDSKNLLDIMERCVTTAELRLMIEICSVRETYQLSEISDIAFLRFENNPAKTFTKKTTNHIFQNILLNNHCDHPKQQSILRKQ